MEKEATHRAGRVSGARGVTGASPNSMSRTLAVSVAASLVLVAAHLVPGGPIVQVSGLQPLAGWTLAACGLYFSFRVWTRAPVTLAAIPVIVLTGIGAIIALLAGNVPLVEPARDLLIVVICVACACWSAPRLERRARLVLRVAGAGSLLVLFGFTKVGWVLAALRAREPWGFAEYIRQLGYPAPALVATVATLSESLGAACVALGILPRIAAAAVTIDMIGSFGTSLYLREEPLRAALYAVIFFVLAAGAPPPAGQRERSAIRLPVRPAPASTSADTAAKLLRYCLGCHRPTPHVLIGPSLAGVSRRYTEQQLTAIITNGRDAMPATANECSRRRVSA